MGRGLPAIWSTLLSLPFIGAGAYLYLTPNQYLELPTSTVTSANLELAGAALIIFGLFILMIGVYVQFVSPTSPSFHGDEEVVDNRTPSQRVALTKIVFGLPFLGASMYLLFFTLIPYVYPTGALAIGLFFLSSGIKTYWANTLTSYYVTSKRVISEYRFISLRRKEIPLTKVRAVEERRSPSEVLVGLGNVRIASGGGGGSVRINIRNIGDPTGFADEIRELINR